MIFADTHIDVSENSYFWDAHHDRLVRTKKEDWGIQETVKLHIDRMREMGMFVASYSSLRFVFEKEPNMDDGEKRII